MITDAVLIALVAFVLVRLEVVWYKLGKLEGYLKGLLNPLERQTDGRTASDPETSDVDD